MLRLITCQHATLLLEQRADKTLPQRTRARLKLHLRHCPLCSRYAEQTALIAEWVRAAATSGANTAAGLSDARLSRGLEQLVASGLVFRRGLMPDVVYRFKHALVQDAAYQTMLLVRRRSLHRPRPQ